MNNKTNLHHVDHPAPFVELNSGKGRKNTHSEFSRLEKSADVYSLLTEKEQRACNQATD